MAKRLPNETLQDLVSRLIAENGWSGRDTARRAEDKGYVLNYNTVNEIRNGRRVVVTDATVEAIAGVFGIPESQVRDAANMPPRDDTTDPELLKLHSTLTPDEKRAALAAYKAYVAGLKRLRTPK